MTVIAELQIASGDFELGRILDLDRDATVSLESMVPLGSNAVPFFWVYERDGGSFESSVRNHPSVEDVTVVESHEDRQLFAINWRHDRDLLFEGIEKEGAQLMSASGSSTVWTFELRFSSHESLGSFREFCDDARIGVEVLRVFNPTKPDAGPWFGLSGPQRETLVRAVEDGYYSIPRRVSTQDLADEFGISDQAVTERLRRAIETLVENTLMLPEDDDERESEPPWR